MAEFKVTLSPGLKKLLEGKPVAQAVAKAVMKTALDTRELLADETPKDTGNTAGRWQVTKVPTESDPTAAVSNDSVVMLYLEYGTQPHVIKPKNAKVLVWRQGQVASATGLGKHAAGTAFKSAKTGKLVTNAKLSGQIFAQVVNHPGTRPRFVVRGNLARISSMLEDNIRAAIKGAL